MGKKAYLSLWFLKDEVYPGKGDMTTNRKDIMQKKEPGSSYCIPTKKKEHELRVRSQCLFHFFCKALPPKDTASL